MLDAGVSKEILDTEKAIGILARGVTDHVSTVPVSSTTVTPFDFVSVTDLWNYGAGNGKLSPYFKERAIQLIYKSKEIFMPSLTACNCSS